MASITINFLSFLMISYVSVGYAETPKKIVGGISATIWEFPHQVSLRVRNQHFCSGSILDKFHILTAASCVTNELGVYLSNVKAISGISDLSNSRNYGHIHNISRITIHEDFNPNNFWINDIAILTLDQEMNLSSRRQPISLPDEYSKFPEIMRAAGWGGRLYPEEEYNQCLQRIKVKVLDDYECEQFYGIFRGLHPSQKCAKPMKENFSGSAMSKGDGGAPLVMKKRIFGILSFSSLTMQAPVVFTEIFPYKKWITDVISAFPTWDI